MVNKEHKIGCGLITIVTVLWIVLLICLFTALVQSVTAHAMAPYIDGSTGEWVYEAVDIDEAPPIGDLSSALDVIDEIVDSPYLTIPISDEEFQELRWVLALEAQGEGLRGEIACCEAILNRCLSKKNDWGQSNGLHGVLSMKGQFSTYKRIGSKKAWAVPGELEDDAISECLRQGCTVLPRMSYVYFDSKGGVNGKNTIKIGNHYFGEE